MPPIIHGAAPAARPWRCRRCSGMPPSAISGTPVPLSAVSHVVDGHDQGHAHARHDTGGADGAWADAHLTASAPVFPPAPAPRTGGDVAADHVHLRVVLLDPAHAVDHALAVAGGRVHHDTASTPALTSALHAFFGALAHTPAAPRAGGQRHRRRIGSAGLLGDVPSTVIRPLRFKGVVHDQDAVSSLLLVEQRLGLYRRGALFSLTVMSFSRGVMIWWTLTS